MATRWSKGATSTSQGADSKDGYKIEAPKTGVKMTGPLTGLPLAAEVAGPTNGCKVGLYK